MFLRPSQRDLGMTPGGRGQGCLVGAWSRTHYSKGWVLRGQVYRTAMCCEKPPVLKMTAWDDSKGRGERRWSGSGQASVAEQGWSHPGPARSC